MTKIPKEVKILAVIPARGGSKGIPKKNIAPVCGKPLIYYSIREALKSKKIDAVIVSTDSKEIAEVAKSYGVDVPFLRPKEISRDDSVDLEFLQHAVSWVEKNRGWRPEIVLFLSPTTPSRSAKDIDDVLEFMIKNDADSVRTFFQPKSFSPFKMWTNEKGKPETFKPLFPEYVGVPRQKKPEYFMPVCLVYATKTEFIKNGRLWGDKLLGYLVPMEKYTDIDEPQDLEHAEQVLKRLKLA